MVGAGLAVLQQVMSLQSHLMDRPAAVEQNVE
jgi:hypothetical protein